VIELDEQKYEVIELAEQRKKSLSENDILLEAQHALVTCR